MLELNLPVYKYRIEQRDGKLAIFDPIRKKFIVLTPEEWVRQHFLNYLNNHLNYPAPLTSVETGLKYNSRVKRSDIMIMDNDLKPLVLVECKAPSIAINEATVRQLATYNAVFRAKLLIVTNGMVTNAALSLTSSETFVPITQIPDFDSLKALI
ncbi:type I restriction enzyme HsdR N-terminal domain-containing protein [Roseivirga sp.]|uniref:type I restriction enzyme HsdR N-terminal domain-containing protein n=1 Tax=Roseivirga sp. TaxID=1964215 RepID=UPI003B8B3ED0